MIAVLRAFAPALSLLAFSGTLAAQSADIVLHNGRIVTLDAKSTIASAIAISGDTITAVGADAAVKSAAGAGALAVDLGGRTVIPGLIDSHIHAVRAGLTYSIEADWSDVTTLAAGLTKVSAAAKARPGAWVLVPGGWHEAQLAEARGPTPEELDRAAPDTPVYVQHLYDYAVLNKKGIERLAIAKDTKVPPAGKLELDDKGEPTGVIRGDLPTFSVLFGKLATLGPEAQLAGTRAFLQDLARSGLTGIIDAAGGGVGLAQYEPLLQLWKRQELPVRVAYYVNSLRPGQELADVQALVSALSANPNDSRLKLLGVGEVVVWGMHDGTLAQARNFVPKPGAAAALKELGIWTAQRRLGLQIHASSNAAAKLLLDTFDEVDATATIKDLRWVLAHIEDASTDTLARMKRLGMIYGVQDRLLFEGDSWPKTVSAEAARNAPPMIDAIAAGLIVAGGTDGTRSAPSNPFVTLEWMVAGRSITGRQVRAPERSPTREQALRINTINAAYMAGDEAKRGTLEVGKWADLIVLSDDYFAVPTERISKITPMLTMVAGKVKHAKLPAFEALVPGTARTPFQK